MIQNVLAQLKSFDENALNVDELVALLSVATRLHDTYEDVGADVPEWLDGQMRKLKRTIRLRQADSIEKQIHEKQARLEALKPATTKRDALAKEIKALKAKLPKGE